MRLIILLATLTLTAAASQAAPASVPGKYARTSAPVAYYLADQAETLRPPQVARLLRQASPQDRLWLSLHPAFASLVHMAACQADPSVVWVQNGMATSCAQTAQSWQQTLQFTGGNMQAAMQQATTERGQLLIAMKCGSGALDGGSCAAWRGANAAANTMNHNNAMRVISNMGDGCLVGDPGCQPY